MSGREWPRLLLGALALLGCGLYVASEWRVRADITRFLPVGERDSEAVLARQVAVGVLSSSMVLLVECGGSDRAASVGRAFEVALRTDPEVAPELASLEGGPPNGIEEAMYRIYHPRRFGFLAASAESAREQLDDAGLATSVSRLKRRLATPMAGMIGRVAPEDPLLIVPDLFERIVGRDPGIGVVDGRYVTADGNAAALFLSTSTSSSDVTAQARFLAAIERVFAAIREQHGSDLKLIASGANRHAVAAERSVSMDIERVSIGSTVALLLVFLALFASLRLPLSWLPILVTGFVFGSASCLLAFGEIHGMTIAFGASLIGVSIDYAVHFYCHQSLASAAGGPRATLRRVWPGLLLGCATTVLGFVVLLVATFPGLREMALFAAVGLSASLAAAWAFLPGLVGPIGSTRMSSWFVRRLEDWTGLRGRLRWWYRLPLLAAAVLVVIGVPKARWNDRLASLNRLDANLAAEDAEVLRRVGKFEQGRLAVGVGEDEEQALVANERIAAALADAEAVGEIAGFRTVAPLLPSSSLQHSVDAAMRGDPTLWPRLERQLVAAGFVAASFAPFRKALSEPAPAPLLPADLLASPLASMAQPFLLPLDDGRVAVVTYMRGIVAPELVDARLKGIPGARLLDVEGALTSAFAAYRSRMATLLAVGVLLVVVVVVVRYRSVRLTALAVVPALLGGACTVAILGLCGIDLNFLSLVALLMVVSMGVDYGIFLAEDEQHPGARGATMLGVVVDGVTTMLGFGLLAFSSHPAMFAIGITAGIGVTLCLTLALCLAPLVASAEPRS